jgi:hypothetical protein
MSGRGQTASATGFYYGFLPRGVISPSRTRGDPSLASSASQPGRGLFLGRAGYAGIARSSVEDQTDAEQRTAHSARGVGDRLARQTLAAFKDGPRRQGVLSRVTRPASNERGAFCLRCMNAPARSKRHLARGYALSGRNAEASAATTTATMTQMIVAFQCR